MTKLPDHKQTTTVTMDKFGRILIPKRVRTQLSVGTGTEFTLTWNDDTPEIELKPKQPVRTWVEYTDWGWPVFASTDSTTVTSEQALRWIREDREEVRGSRDNE